MKVVFNKFIPFEGFMALTFLNLIFVRLEYKGVQDSNLFKVMLNHENIHFEQEKELGFIFFYVLYLLEWFIKLFIYGNRAYSNISFEREAYEHENDFEYLKTRKRYNWLKKIF